MAEETNPETILAAGKRIAATASGRAFKEDSHEDERLAPGIQGGSASGAPAGKPSDPANSA